MGAVELISIDGSVQPTAGATIPVADDGLYRGDGAFEVIRLYGGHPYALDEHLERLERSAAALELPVERRLLEGEIDTLLKAAGEVDAALRLVVTRGGRRIAAVEPLPDKGETVALATVTHSPTHILTGVKSLSYAANMQATRLANGQGADEALLVRPDRIVLEAPTSTIFWARADGTLHTPAIDTGILDSITRRRVVEELEVEEDEYTLEELLSAGEAFLASTVREVQPITRIDDVELLLGGPRTVEARRAFDGVVERALRENR